MLTRFALALALAGGSSAAFTLQAATAAARFDGKPQFKEGKALGYFIWRDGDTWKVRWTTFGAEKRFTGTVLVEGGELRSFTRIDVDHERRLIRPGRPGRVVRGPRGRVRAVSPGRAPVVAERDEDHINQENEHQIRFSARTDDDIDGFDFTVGERTDRIRFRLEIDGRIKADDIEIGARNIHPDEDPLVAVLR
ncbi:MAG TPA: hypothetical protein VM032_03675 [Vicinamibacterales bacterium]|nr:hypothetical protein [Vicinamibacterales bacterium]